MQVKKIDLGTQQKEFDQRSKVIFNALSRSCQSIDENNLRALTTIITFYDINKFSIDEIHARTKIYTKKIIDYIVHNSINHDLSSWLEILYIISIEDKLSTELPENILSSSSDLEEILIDSTCKEIQHTIDASSEPTLFKNIRKEVREAIQTKNNNGINFSFLNHLIINNNYIAKQIKEATLIYRKNILSHLFKKTFQKFTNNVIKQIIHKNLLPNKEIFKFDINNALNNALQKSLKSILIRTCLIQSHDKYEDKKSQKKIIKQEKIKQNAEIVFAMLNSHNPHYLKKLPRALCDNQALRDEIARLKNIGISTINAASKAESFVKSYQEVINTPTKEHKKTRTVG